MDREPVRPARWRRARRRRRQDGHEALGKGGLVDAPRSFRIEAVVPRIREGAQLLAVEPAVSIPIALGEERLGQGGRRSGGGAQSVGRRKTLIVANGGGMDA